MADNDQDEQLDATGVEGGEAPLQPDPGADSTGQEAGPDWAAMMDAGSSSSANDKLGAERVEEGGVGRGESCG